MTVHDELRQYVIYGHPSDYPNGYAVRGWTITSGLGVQADVEMFGFDTLREARDFVLAQPPMAWVCLSRSEADDPSILEIWT